MSVVGGFPHHPVMYDIYPYVAAGRRHHDDSLYVRGWVLGSAADMTSDYAPVPCPYNGLAVSAAAAAAAAELSYPSAVLGAPGGLQVPDPSGCCGGLRALGERRKRLRAGALLGAAPAPRKERRRTQSINSAFAELRGHIPNVPSDTKLSKIKTLRLATSYIGYLMDILAKGEQSGEAPGFKADLSEPERREERQMDSGVRAVKDSVKKTAGERRKGRTGWPQHVWAQELKR
uniref:Heart and neural crest derivatives expressed 2 n=1 Tax=Eptatretus burgeri TaxID=7764 RepID=A0A8C4Q840_EPTBU